MYIPPAFAETDVSRLHDAIERYSFAVLVSNGSGELFGSHLPLLIDRSQGQRGTLLGHMARANPQWRSAADQEVLVVFHGPHTYISPAWYEAPQTVPTWNYIAVHANGRLELIEDEAETLAILNRTVENYEAHLARPWRLEESPEFVGRLAAQIVAFRIPIERLEGKWKLNQNRPVEQRQRVIEQLSRHGNEDACAIAEAMTRLNCES
jgi:transcriptional regulator